MEFVQFKPAQSNISEDIQLAYLEHFGRHFGSVFVPDQLLSDSVDIDENSVDKLAFCNRYYLTLTENRDHTTIPQAIMESCIMHSLRGDYKALIDTKLPQSLFVWKMPEPVVAYDPTENIVPIFVPKTVYSRLHQAKEDGIPFQKFVRISTDIVRNVGAPGFNTVLIGYLKMTQRSMLPLIIGGWMQ